MLPTRGNRSNHEAVAGEPMPSKDIILREIQTDMVIRAERLKLKAKDGVNTDNEYFESNNDDAACSKFDQLSPGKGTGFRTFTKEVRTVLINPVVQRESSSSKIPKPRGNYKPLTQMVPSKSPIKMKVPIKSKKTPRGFQVYNPSYTWNKGGRLKELRIRTLARKFLHLWIQGVFGRCLPSTAKLHYDKKLLKKTFEVWLEDWWVLRKEWGLLIRADLHYRYVTWNKVWGAWKEYTEHQREKSVKLKIAVTHANRKTLQLHFNILAEYAKSRKVKNLIKLSADKVHSMNTQRFYWVLWKRQIRIAQVRKYQMKDAQEFYFENLKSKAWTIWLKRLTGQLQEKGQMKVASRHFNSQIVRRCLRAWIIYAQTRHTKLVAYAAAEEVWTFMLIRRHFAIWQQRLDIAVAVKKHKEAIDYLSRRVQCRRILQHWKHYIQVQREKAECYKLAENHRDQVLKLTVLRVLKLNAVNKRIQFMRKQQADEFHREKLQQSAWQRWQIAVEEIEEADLEVVSNLAREYHIRKILKDAFKQLSDYMMYRKKKKYQKRIADAHFFHHTMPNYITRWRDFIDISTRQNEMKEQAKMFLQENLVAKFFYAWHDNFVLSQDLRMLDRMAILHDEERTKRAFFEEWRQKTESSLQDTFNMEVADEHYQERLCRTALSHWKIFIKDTRKEQSNDQMALQHWYIKSLQKGFEALKKYVAKREAKEIQRAKADNHYKKIALQKVLDLWKCQRQRTLHLKAKAEEKWSKKARVTLRHAFNEWRMNVQILIQEKQKHMLVECHYHETLLRKVFLHWHSYIVQKAQMDAWRTEKLEQARVVLDRVKLSQIFNKWRWRYFECKMDDFRQQRALEHYQSVILPKTWCAWRQFTALMIRKRLLERQSTWFRQTHLQARCFLQWRHQMDESEITKEKEMLALWQWSLVLQRKVLLNWLKYSMEKKKKKERVNRALELRRKRLLRDGCVQWMRTAADLSAIRQRIAMQEGMKEAFRSRELVRRCANHWREITIRSRGCPVKQTVKVATRRKASFEFRVDDAPGDNIPTIGKDKTRGSVSQLAGKNNLKMTLDSVPTRPFFSSASPMRAPTLTKTRMIPSQIHIVARQTPRLPSFLRDSLKRDGLYQSTLYESFQISNEDQDEKSLKDVSPLCGNSEMQEVEKSIPMNSMLSNKPASHPENVEGLVCNAFIPDNKGDHSQLNKQDNIESTNKITVQTALPFSNDLAPRLITTMKDDSSTSSDMELMPPSAFLGVKGKDIHGAHNSMPLPDSTNVCTKEEKMTTELLLPHDLMREHNKVSLSDGANGSGSPSEFRDISHVEIKPPSFLTAADEMLFIRDELQKHKIMRDRYRMILEQQRHLKSWLSEQTSYDTDVLQTKEELKLLEEEVEVLQQRIVSDKERVQRLTKRAKTLLPTLNKSH